MVATNNHLYNGSLAGDDLRMVVAAYAKVLYYDRFFTTVPYGDVYNNIFVVISRYLALGGSVSLAKGREKGGKEAETKELKPSKW